MRVAITIKLVLVLLAISSAAVAGGFLVARMLPCGFERCPALSGDGAVATRLGDGTYRHLTLGGRPAGGITPGATVPINVRVTNPNTFAVAAGHLAVRLGAIRAPRATATRPCTVRDFTIAQAPAGLALVLQPRQTTTLLARGVPRADWPAVRMIYRGTNQDGCKAAIVTLRYTVSGRQFKR